MQIYEIRAKVEVDVIDDSGTKATLQTSGFREKEIKKLIFDYSSNNRKVELIGLHEFLLTQCRSNQQTVNIIFKNTPLIP